MKCNSSPLCLWRFSYVLILLLFLSACSSSPLPKGEDTVRSPWTSFEQVKTAYDKIILNESDTTDLQRLGFDPYSTPNVSILSYLDIVERFSPNNLVRPEDLPPSVRQCLAAREQCIAYEVTPKVSKSERVGNLFLDLFKFERRRIETGWHFNALIVIDHNIAVYKVWSGTPIINQHKMRKTHLDQFKARLSLLQKIRREYSTTNAT